MSPARSGWACGVAVALFVSAVTPATPLVGQEDFFVEGNRLYREGDFAGALESYLRIEEAGFESGALYYNIGNSYFKLGELGSAILYYERARRLMPGDDDLQANLDLARTLTVDEVNPLPGFLPIRAIRWWIHLLPPRVLTWLVGLTYVSAMVGLTLWVLWRGSSAGTWAGRMAGAMGLVAAVFGVNLLAVELGIGEARRAVVLDEAADVQSAPSDDPSLQVFTVHEGTTVRIDRQSGDWVEIVLDDGKVGWLELGALEEI
jgi:tetratricopeptide (TPR) repeat protein